MGKAGTVSIVELISIDDAGVVTSMARVAETLDLLGERFHPLTRLLSPLDFFNL